MRKRNVKRDREIAGFLVSLSEGLREQAYINMGEHDHPAVHAVGAALIHLAGEIETLSVALRSTDSYIDIPDDEQVPF